MVIVKYCLPLWNNQKEMNTKEIITESDKAHKSKVDALLLSGQTIVIVRDAHNEAWVSGWAEYLSANYHYSNLNSAFRVNLEKPIK